MLGHPAISWITASLVLCMLSLESPHNNFSYISSRSEHWLDACRHLNPWPAKIHSHDEGLKVRDSVECREVWKLGSWSSEIRPECSEVVDEYPANKRLPG